MGLFVKPKKSSLVCGKWPGENLFIIYPPAFSNVYQNKRLKNKTKQTNKQTKNRQNAKKTKEEKRISAEALTACNIIWEFALCTFNLL